MKVTLSLFYCLIFQTLLSQNQVHQLGNVSDLVKDSIVRSYLEPIEGSSFYSENNESNKYEYTFYPDMPLVLGRGMDPNKLQETKFSPLKEIKKETVDGLRPISSTAEIYLINNKEELKKVFELDVKLSIRYLGFKGKSHLNIINNYEFKQNNLLVVIKGKSEFSRTGILDPQLSDEALKIIGSRNGYRKFIQIYGTNIVSIERRGVSVYFLITINNLSSSTKNSLNASISTSGKFGPVTGSLEVKLKKEIEKKHKKEELNIKFVSFGGGGISDFGGIIANLTSMNNSFDNIKQELSDVLKTYSDYSQAVPIGYLVTPMSNIPSVHSYKYKDPFNLIQEKYLAALSHKYLKNKQILATLENIKQQRHPFSWYISKKDLETINQSIPIQKLYVQKLGELHSTILNSFEELGDDPESEIERRLVVMSQTGITTLNSSLDIINSKNLSIISKKEFYNITGEGIKGVNFYIQGENYNYVNSENSTDRDYQISENIFEIKSLIKTDDGIDISNILGETTEFEITKSELLKNLISGAKGLKDNGDIKFNKELKTYDYFSVTCVISSLFGNQIRIPIGYLKHENTKTPFSLKLRDELKYDDTSFISNMN